MKLTIRKIYKIFKNINLAKLFHNAILCILTLLLTNCATISDNYPDNNALNKIKNPYTQNARKYINEAKTQQGLKKQESLVLAAGSLIEQGKWEQGSRLLSQTQKLPPELDAKKNLLIAKTYLLQERAHNALLKLAKVNEVGSLDNYYKIQFHKLLAEAYFALGKGQESIQERIKLAEFLTDNEAKNANAKLLWLSLVVLPIEEINTTIIENSQNKQLTAWYELAAIAHETNNITLISAVEAWQKKYASHPANSIISASGTEGVFFANKNVALLLPLTGALSGPGNAIKDGFLKTHAINDSLNQIKVCIYNTDGENIESLYQKALANGADYIIGPLSKTDVMKVAALKHPVPTLLLNEFGSAAKSNIYQFGLSPVNEARQVATKAYGKGLTRALVIAPKDDWGNEVVKAFQNKLQDEGGKVIDTLTYDFASDLNNNIQDFLATKKSEERGRKIKSLLGNKVEVVVNRRQDFDMIFVLAYPSKGREIIPLLKYYYASDIPIFATSSIYAGLPNPMKDRDLNGVIFCDMPWIFSNNLAATFPHKNWPEYYNSYSRLYALGMESYMLSQKHKLLLAFPGLGGESGVLYLNPNKQVSRIMAWGRFENGAPKLIG